jgi:superfamily II DNA helicase RecQ
MRSAEFTQNVLAVIVDEAYCVSQWGESFCKRFGELGRLRSYVQTTVPFLATSATLPCLVLADVQSKLQFIEDETYIVNLGNNRPNLTPVLCQMRSAVGDLESLDFVLDEAFTGDTLKWTIVFFNMRDVTFKAWQHLRQQLPEHTQDQVDFIHTGRTPRAIRKVIKDFRSHKVNILCATEAAGMVCSTYFYTNCLQVQS